MMFASLGWSRSYLWILLEGRAGGGRFCWSVQRGAAPRGSCGWVPLNSGGDLFHISLPSPQGPVCLPGYPCDPCTWTDSGTVVAAG